MSDGLVRLYDNFFKEFCKARGLDPQSVHLRETPKRVVHALLEFTKGYQVDVRSILERTFETCETNACSDASETTLALPHGLLVIHSGISFTSICAHHLLPFYGYAYIGMLLTSHLLGLSKVARVVEIFSQRLQVQEELTTQIAKALSSVTGCSGVIVLMDGIHGCMCHRGVKQNSVTTTSAVTGRFLEDDKGVKEEFFSVIAPLRKALR
jgi:GTP cyclohydrolase I